MKAGVVAGLEAVRAAAAAVGGGGGGGVSSSRFLLKRTAVGHARRIRAGVTGDGEVIPEPTDLDIVIAHAGAITFRPTVLGQGRPCLDAPLKASPPSTSSRS